MTDAVAILATFSDFQLVRSRKVARLVFEVPIEQAKAALDVLGMPNPVGETWCGIARTVSPGRGKAAGDGIYREANTSPSEQTPADSGAGVVQYKSPAANSVAPMTGDDTGGAPLRAFAAPPVPKRKWHEMPYSQRAALLVHSPEFMAFLNEHRIGGQLMTEDAVDQRLKDICGITSKADLDSHLNSTACTKFENLVGSFRAWQQYRGHSK
jgi:hypothetical protein